MVRNPLLEEGRHLSVPAGQQISYQIWSLQEQG